MSPAIAHRPAHCADAALHQGSSVAQQHSPTYRRPARETPPLRLSRGAGKVAQSV